MVPVYVCKCVGVKVWVWVWLLENLNGFSGDYIGGDTITTVLARDCWLD